MRSVWKILFVWIAFCLPVAEAQNCEFKKCVEEKGTVTGCVNKLKEKDTLRQYIESDKYSKIFENRPDESQQGIVQVWIGVMAGIWSPSPVGLFRKDLGHRIRSDVNQSYGNM